MKEYQGEKAIISLTSWKARINTVGKTIYSLIKQCPGFHIVLVLSEEEFPKKEKELPEDLMLFVNNNLIEILWVYKNYKSFKKVLFTMDKYRDVPIISADDDCIYTCNYAEELYQKWLERKKSIITWDKQYNSKFEWCRGPATIYPPAIFNLDLVFHVLKNIDPTLNGNDDAFLAAIIYKNKLKIIDMQRKWNALCLIHDDSFALSKKYRYDVNRDINYYLSRMK